MADWGLKITKAGKAITSTTPEDYIFNSQYASVRIVQQGMGTITVPASSSAYGTVAHNLGYAPIAITYVELTPSSGRFCLAGGNSPLDTGCYQQKNTAAATDSYVGTANMVLQVTNPTGSSNDIRYYYYILGNTAQ